MTERGSVSTLTLAVMGVVLIATIALMAVTSLVSAKVAAQTAADAAALAAAATSHPTFAEGAVPCREAARLAAANGARLVVCRSEPNRSFRSRVALVAVAVEVEVPVWGQVEVGATARAEFDPVAALTGP